MFLVSNTLIKFSIKVAKNRKLALYFFDLRMSTKIRKRKQRGKKRPDRNQEGRKELKVIRS